MNGLIEGYVGTEGSGKTTLMTYMLDRARKAGVKIFAFPGYCLKDEKGEKVISEAITPKEFIENFRIMRNVAVGIDEITNFGIDAYSFNGVFSKIFGYAAAMRRKLSMSLLYTVQNFEYIPPRIRFFSHTLMYCKDMYFGRQYTDKKIPRGVLLEVARQDLKGFYTGKERSMGMRKVFHSQGVWKRFETESVVDIEWGQMKYQYNKNKIMIGQETPNLNGYNPLAGDSEELIKSNAESLRQIAPMTQADKRVLVGQWVDQLREYNIAELSVPMVKMKLSNLGMDLSDKDRGHYLKGKGVEYNGRRGVYIFNPNNQFN